MPKPRLLFLTLLAINRVEDRGIYNDLIREFIRHGHHVTIVSPVQRRERRPVGVTEGPGYRLIRFKTFNNQKTSAPEKLLSLFSVDALFRRAVRRHVDAASVDWCLYTTPPIMLTRTVAHVRRRYGARTYLLLKDIFPDNAADLNLLKRGGRMYRHFRGVERKLYALSDGIGCMSPANVRYVLDHNPEVPATKVEVCPNAVDPLPVAPPAHRAEVRARYDIPDSAVVFFYGGNFGKPQMIDFILEVLDHYRDHERVFFLLVGGGTEFGRLRAWYERTEPRAARVLSSVPKEEFDQLIEAADVGLVFLDRRFRIPNFPSRLLSYLENQLPVLCATDTASDMGPLAEENGFGFWCPSGDLPAFTTKMNEVLALSDEARRAMGRTGRTYLENNYTTERAYEIIAARLGKPIAT